MLIIEPLLPNLPDFSILIIVQPLPILPDLLMLIIEPPLPILSYSPIIIIEPPSPSASFETELSTASCEMPLLPSDESGGGTVSSFFVRGGSSPPLPSPEAAIDALSIGVVPRKTRTALYRGGFTALANERRDIMAKRRQHHDAAPTMIVITPRSVNRRWRRWALSSFPPSLLLILCGQTLTPELLIE